METVIQFCGIAAICTAILIVMAVIVCALIDYTRKVEDPIGSLADEEKEKEADDER